MATTLNLFNKLNAVKRRLTAQGDEQKSLPEGIAFVVDDKALIRVKAHQMRLMSSAVLVNISVNGLISPTFFAALSDHMKTHVPNSDEQKTESEHMRKLRVIDYASQLKAAEFLKILLETQPVTSGENKEQKYSQPEMEIINNVGYAATVTVYQNDIDNGANGIDIPFQAQILFTNPNFVPPKIEIPTKNKSASEETKQADEAQLKGAELKQLQEYFNQRVLPHLIHANLTAGNANKKAFVTIPPLVNEELKANFKAQYNQKMLETIITMIEKKASELPNIQGVYLDIEGVANKKSAGHVAILTKNDCQEAKTVSHPMEYGNDYKHCMLFKMVEGNALQFDGDVQRNRSKAVVERVTNVMAVVTQQVALGHFNEKKSTYEPIAKDGTPTSNWDGLIKKTKPSATISMGQEQKDNSTTLTQTQQELTVVKKEVLNEIEESKHDQGFTGEAKKALHNLVGKFETMGKRLSDFLDKYKPEVKVDAAEKKRTLQAIKDVFKGISTEMKEAINQLRAEQKVGLNLKEKQNPLHEMQTKHNSLYEPPTNRKTF